MRNLHLEASIWNLFTSVDFFMAAARECETTMKWFGDLALARRVANLGRNNQVFDTFKSLEHDFRIGAELASLGDYKLIWETAGAARGDVRGMMDQPLHSWMSENEYQEFSAVRVGRLLTYARQITRALHNALVGADSFFEPDPECPERSNDDDGFPGDKIVEAYNTQLNESSSALHWKLPDPLQEYLIDKSVSCRTGDQVSWTGVWFPATGLERHSLTFAIKGLRMQPAYHVVKTQEELKHENGGATFFSPETIAVPTIWHPVVPSGKAFETDRELWAKAGNPCPKAGIWQPTDPGVPGRHYEFGETMANLGSAYGYTVWRWIAER